MKELFLIGTISSTHGLLGAFKIKHNFRRANDIYKYDKVYIFGHEEPFPIERVILKKNSIYLKVRGIETIDQAEKLINYAIYVDSLHMDENEKMFKESELLRIKVYLEDKTYVGQIGSIIEGPRQDLLVIEKDGEQAMIPFVESFISNVDLERGEITIHPIEGLIPWL